MTTELPHHAQLLLLDQHQVSALLQPDDVLAAVREAFVLHSTGQGQVFPVVREALTTGGVFGIKSGTVPGQGLLGFKAAGFWPGNRHLGAEPHQATILLIDPATGRPLCMIDGNAVTTQRTGAAGGLGLLALARPDSRRITVFGTGVQARVQLNFALRLLPTLQQILYLSSSGRPRPDFEAAITKAFPACVIAHATNGDTAVADSELKRKDRTKAINVVKKNHERYVGEVIPNLFLTTDTPELKKAEKKALEIASTTSKQGIIAALEGMKIRDNRELVVKFAPCPVFYVIGKLDKLLPYQDLMEQSILNDDEIIGIVRKPSDISHLY